MTYETWWEQFSSEHDEWRYADSKALRKAAFEAENADLRQQVTLLRDALTESRRELDSCQKVIWLASDYGFDPAYVKGAQESIRKTDEALAATEPKP